MNYGQKWPADETDRKKSTGGSCETDGAKGPENCFTTYLPQCKRVKHLKTKARNLSTVWRFIRGLFTLPKMNNATRM